MSLDLQLGDIVVFASDGILECQNREQEVFGASRLGAVLASLPPEASAKDISTAILSATDEFSHDPSSPDDDRSLIVLRLTDEPSADFPRLPLIY